MAYHEGHQNSHLDIHVYNVPPLFSFLKLGLKLQEKAGCSVYNIKRISESCIRARVETHKGKQNLLKEPIPISFGNSQFHLKVESLCTDSDDGDESDVFIYQPTSVETKAIVRYLAHENDHLLKIRSELKHLGELSAADAHIEVKRNKRAALNEMERKQWEDECEKCIEDLIKKMYSFWPYSPQKCSHTDSKYLNSLNGQYKGKCFVRWFKDSSTLNVTGKNEIVNEVKQEVLSHMEPSDSKKQTFHAHAFEYDEEEPAVLRFISRKKNFHDDLKQLIPSVADIEIMQNEEKNLTVNVRPSLNWKRKPHQKFEGNCREKIKLFFSNFETWKGRFNPTVIGNLARRDKDFFGRKNEPGVYVQWHLDSGVVDVTGLRQEVNHCRVIILNRVGYHNQLQPASSTTLPSPKKHESFPQSPAKNDKGRTGKTCEFDTSTIPAAVLKFVNRNFIHKKELERCCSKMARVNMTSEKGQIKIDILIKKERTSEEQCFQAVKEYFSRFQTETLKYDKMELKDAYSRSFDIFSPDSGVFCQCFPETGTVKVTGLKENFLKKKEEIVRELECKTEEEFLPVDVYIAQEKCGVWSMTEKKFSNKVIITPFPSDKPKIVYKGLKNDIKMARRQLGKFSEKLIDKSVTGLTERQLEFLKSCEQSQKNSLSSGENRLDALYGDFKKHNVHGSLAFQNLKVHLICLSENEWKKGNMLLRTNISEFSIELNDHQVSCLKASTWKFALESMKHLPALINKENKSKIISVVCHYAAADEVKKEIAISITAIEGKRILYRMPIEKGEHIKRFHKLDHATPSVSERGLVLTCSEEDMDAVEMWMEDLEIVHKTVHLSGYSLYEYLSGEGKPFVTTVENDTKCSVFLKSQQKTKHSKQNHEMVKVVSGSILDEKCDAIVNSTGKDINFSGQVSSSLLKKYGPTFSQLCQDKTQWLVKDRLCVTGTGGSLPWKCIFHIMTPTEKKQLTETVSMLLQKADQLPIKSIALPTIGMGNLGLPATQVSMCMKEAIETFLAQQPSNLEEIKIVVFDSQFHADFQKIVPQKDAMSTGLSAVIYGNDQQSVDQTELKLKKVKEDHMKSVALICGVIQNIPSSLKAEIAKYCVDANIQLRWKNNGSSGECLLEGITMKVHKVEEKIKKLLHQDLPYNWAPMRDGERFVKVELEKSSTEYLDVKRLFLQSNPYTNCIRKIERIQNCFLYKQYKARKDLIKGDPGEIITRELFHGTTKDKVEKICSSGFDRNFAGENGTAFGRGVYFAVDSHYSVSYTDRTASIKYMFLADVITGKYTLGNSSYKAAPEIGNTKVQYDSVVNNLANPTIFVVFRDSSVYPTYLITFQ